jgi:hypothetical protein
VSAAPATTIYEPLVPPIHDNATLGSIDVRTLVFNSLIQDDDGLGQASASVGEGTHFVYFATGELARAYDSTMDCTVGFYAAPTEQRAWRGDNAIGGESGLLLSAVARPCLISVDRTNRTWPKTSSEADSGNLPSTVEQRREREATAVLALEIEELLPEFSENDLARLVGVTRATWRDWSSGARVARRGSRKRILRLRRILELRRDADPDAALSHWLDTPLTQDLDRTPARLLAEGRDQLVAMLAASLEPSTGDGLLLTPSRMEGVVDLEQIDRDFAADRQLYSESDEDGDV